MNERGVGHFPQRGSPAVWEPVQRFEVLLRDRTVPGALWTPACLPGQTASGLPLILVQHGGSGHKLDAPTRGLANRLTAALGAAVLAIDGPWHGDRCPWPGERPGVLRERFLQHWRTEPAIAAYVEDWQAALAFVLKESPFIDESRLGWYGLSMGTAYGLPLIAQLKQVKTAVLGKWSSGYPNSHALLRWVEQVECPTLFIHHDDDELFDRDGCHALFAALASSEKLWLSYPGTHGGRSEQELQDSIRQLALA